MANTQFTLIIPAAGSGSRMQKEVPKPFLKLGEYSIIQQTVRKFAGFRDLRRVVIAASDSFRDQARNVSEVLPAHVELLIADGGRERQDSIYNALQLTEPAAHLVAIHDAVRPFVSEQEIRKCLDTAFQSGAAILGIPVHDTIKRTDGRNRIMETPDRNRLWNAQTPQIFHRKIILDAYNYARNNDFSGTDDASVVEYGGGKVLIVPGSRENFKITYPLDLQVAELLIGKS